MGHYVQRQWRADMGAYGGRRSRQSFLYDAYIPADIAEADYSLPADVLQSVIEAEAAIHDLNDHSSAHSLESVARQLLRSESVASSRIEGLELSQRRVAEALFDPEHSDVTARSVVNNILAMEEAIRRGDQAQAITIADIIAIHRTLLNTPGDARIAGVIRTSQNWIGGNSVNPRDAAFVPPPEDEVPRLLDDLCVFLNRDDLPAVVQAAIAHAQFETIHPFADGNGRVGRCLIHVVLRRRGYGRRYVPPVSVILATHARAYIEGLTAYRAGNVSEWCALFAAAVRTAGRRALDLTYQLNALLDEWWNRARRPRRRSAAQRLIDVLPAYPIVNATTVSQAIGVSEQVARLAIRHLDEANILSQITVGRRNRAWAAKELFQVINSFEFDLATPDISDDYRRPSPTQGLR